MTTEAKELYNAYQREWRKKNPGKDAEYKKNYWERKAAELMEASKGGGDHNQSKKSNN